jgi:hypothetical protein
MNGAWMGEGRRPAHRPRGEGEDLSSLLAARRGQQRDAPWEEEELLCRTESKGRGAGQRRSATMVGPRSRGKRRGRRPCGGRRRHGSRELAGGCCCREEERQGSCGGCIFLRGGSAKMPPLARRWLLFIERH